MIEPLTIAAAIAAAFIYLAVRAVRQSRKRDSACGGCCCAKKLIKTK
jgi:hypothetical protein